MCNASLLSHEEKLKLDILFYIFKYICSVYYWTWVLSKTYYMLDFIALF